MNDSRTLEPSGDERTWIMIEMETEIHVYPNFGPAHQTKDCWCKPDVEQDESMRIPMYSHRELH